jgi:hypothetical protein
MLKPFRLATCGLVAVGVAASGCGSSKKPSTPTTTSTSTNITATAGTTQSTTPKHTPQTPKPRAQKPAATTPPAATTGSQKSVQAPKPKIKQEPKAPPKGKYEYPLEAQRNFIGTCRASNSSKSSCECIIVKFESRKVEEGQSLAELLGVEVALKGHLTLSHRAQQYARECKSTI